MKLPPPTNHHPAPAHPARNGSVLIIVLWVCIGLVSIALYFANTMTYELRASDNRVSGCAADQAIEGAARYVSLVLLNFATNGAVPDPSFYHAEAVPVGDAKFWILGRNPTEDNPTEVSFGLIDEGGKLNLNSVSTNILQYLPNMTTDFTEAVLDWRSTNGSVNLNYASLGYAPKYAPFETVDELRLVYGATTEFLVGEDLNRNGVLDPGEKDQNGNGQLDPGLFEYTTVYTREPNDTTTLTNVSTARRSQLEGLLQSANLSTKYVQAITNGNNRPYPGILKFAQVCKNAGMSADDFSRIANLVTTSTNTYFRNRVNINTANVDVLTALFMGAGIDEQTALSAAKTMINYRRQNSSRLNSVYWMLDALGNSEVINALVRRDWVTTHSYQFTADIAAVGPLGRGYRRVKFIFDVSDGTPKILYRQDLSRLGWALGEKTRENLVAKDTQ
jgi:type II secretory pathway component PulK